MASTGLSHVELTVRDLARSLHFYCDLAWLACHSGRHGAGSARQPIIMTGIFERPNRKFRFVVLHYSAEPAGPYGMGPGAPIIVLLAATGPITHGHEH